MILAIDQGTTGSTCLVFDYSGELIGRSYREFQQHYPQPGWVEHDAEEIWQVTHQVAGEALADAGLAAGELQAIGITNQRETVVVWDAATGKSLHKALVWQDRRTTDRCKELKELGHEELIRQRTGLLIDPYFSATKIEWLLRNVDGLAERAVKGEVKFGTVDAWLAYKLTGRCVTDASNASRTLLYNIQEGCWDSELLELFSVPEAALPEVVASSGVVGETDPEQFHGQRAQLAGVAGDQQSALFGQACLTPGLAKNTYGTGSFLLTNTGSELSGASGEVLQTVAWQIGDRLTYAQEASIFIAGAAIQWLRDGLGVIELAADSEQLAASLDSNDGVYFVPALTGLGSPYWDPTARGTIVGLTRGSGVAHLARAALEAIAYQSVDALQAAERQSGIKVEQLRVDGGATANSWLMQFQADILGIPVAVAELAETTALGAFYLAAVGTGVLTLDAVRSSQRESRVYEPAMSKDQSEELLANWRRAVERSRNWAN